MQRKLFVFLAVLTVLAAALPSPVAARPGAGTALVLFVVDEDIWGWREGMAQPEPLTQNAHVVDTPVLSPDGSTLALLVASPVTVQVWETTGGFSGRPPADVALLDLGTGALTVVAEQPADAVLFSETGQDNAFIRAAPTWSPDGTQIAWTELHYSAMEPELHRLMVYDLASGQTRVVATNLPEFAGAGPSSLPPYWGAPAIALFQPDFDALTSTFPIDFLFYTPDGRLLSEARIPDDPQRNPVDWAWVATDAGTLFGVQYANGTWELIDPQSGLVTHTATPELYSLTAPESSLALRFDVDTSGPWNQNRTWIVFAPGDVPTATLPYKGNTVVMAPDGNAFAYLDAANQLVVWESGAAVNTGVTLPGYPTLFAWGPVGWRELAAVPLPEVTAPPPVCQASLPTRLVPGDTAQVIPNTTPNAVRAAPATGEVIGLIPAGGQFEVLEGPQCGNGLLWWQVDYQGLVGWTAEGDASGYWIEPLG